MSKHNMTKIILGLALTTALLLPTEPVAAQTDYQVVVNDSRTVSSMTKKEIAALFRKNVTKWDDGLKVQPVDQGPSRSVREAFTEAVHGKSVASIKAYWQKMIFSGRATPPPELNNNTEVLDFVRQNSGAIGYVSAGTSLGSGVKSLRVTDG